MNHRFMLLLTMVWCLMPCLGRSAGLSPTTSPVLQEPAADSIEARTLRRGVAQRQPAESVDAFLHRVLPASFQASDGAFPKVVQYAWRPSAFGKQVFFSVRGTETSGNDYGTDLFMLDPFESNTYAVEVFNIPSQGDETNLEAFFFADVDRDGQKELLAIGACSLREGRVNGFYPRTTHYQTQVFQYTGLNSTGCPQYRGYPKDTSYLDELSTAAAVRHALAAPPVRKRKIPSSTPAKATKK